MRKIVVLAAMSIFAMTNAWAKGDAEAGKKIAEAQCASCHGADGNSVNPDWPKLAGQGEGYIVKQLQNFKAAMTKNGDIARDNALMGPLASALSFTDMKNVAAYYATQQVGYGGVNKKYVELGEQLYRFGDQKREVPACTACHGPTGSGLDAAKFPGISGQHPKYTVTQLKAFRDGLRANDPNGMMRGIAEKMTDKQIEAIAHYLLGLH